MLTVQDIKCRGTTLWCVGLPLLEERRLEREEQECLRRVAWRLLWQGLGMFLGLAVFGGLLMALVSVLGGAWGGTLLIIVVIFVALLLFLPASLFAHEFPTQRGLLLFRDLRRGHVRVFGGTLTENDLLQTEEAVDEAQRRLLALKLLTLDGTRKQVIEALPVSLRGWRVGDERIKPWIEVRCKEVAAVEEATSSWLHAHSSAFSSGGVSLRKLSSRECAELFGKARQHWLRPLVPAVLLTSWLLLILVLALVTTLKAGHFSVSSGLWGSVHVIWLAVAADTFFLRRLAQARLMYQDARGAEVQVTFQQATFQADAQDSHHPQSVSETLPHSQRLWTQAGRPAAWRRISR